MTTGKLLVYLTIFSLVALIVYRYYSTDRSDYTTEPQEVTLKYIPSDFKPDIDEENALAILSNPERYKKEFGELVYDVNQQLIRHVAIRMGLSDSLQRRVAKEYETQHPYLRTLYYNDFVTLKDTTSQLYQMWYANEFTNAVELMNEVASKYTCFLVNQIFSSVIKTDEGRYLAKGKRIDTPCGIALTEALAPVMKRLAERAAIDDFSRSKGMIQERIEKVIAELATMELRDQKGLSKQMQTKLFGFSVSSTDIEVSAISIIKVGFKLDRYFDMNLNSKNGVVTITLPEPVILSHEVYPKIDKLDIGWLREVKSIDLNKNINALREAFREDAINSDLFDKSKKQATELMETMMSPMVKSMNKRYTLKVRFKSLEERPFEDEMEDRTPAKSAGQPAG